MNTNMATLLEMIATSALLAPIVRLRLAIEETRDAQLRDELREIEVSLRRQLGPSVPKRAAAHLVGVSVTALDRWIDRGHLPVVGSPRGSKRLALETGPLLELATRVRRLRRAGCSHAVVSRAMQSSAGASVVTVWSSVSMSPASPVRTSLSTNSSSSSRRQPPRNAFSRWLRSTAP